MYENFETASQVWSKLDGRRQPMIDRAERYAALTIPTVCLPDGFIPESMDITHDWQSLGAQATNHVVNKLMTAMFAPSRPFFRVAEGKRTKAMAAKLGLSETALADTLANMERTSSKALDERGQRPKLYTVMRHLVVAGNVLLILDNDQLRTMGLKYYCVRRNYQGKVVQLVIREKMRFCDLDEKVQALWSTKYQKDDECYYYKLINYHSRGGYHMTQWVDEARLPKEWEARWTEDKFPYLALTWNLADESDYGTGLVEDYAGDFEALSQLSEAIVTGGVIGTEFRWVNNPNGLTSIEDFRNSVNGDTISGNAKDVTAIAPPVTEGVKVAQAVAQEYVQRISRGFLMTSAVTRNAERVTAEEVRMNALELEGAFGGTYSSLAPQVQKPIAQWMLATADFDVKGSDLNIVIVTGLDALSRNGELESLDVAFTKLAKFATAPEPLLQRTKWQELSDFIGQGCGIDLKRFIMSEQEFAAVQQQMMAQQGALEAQTAGATAQAEAAAQPEGI